MVGGLPDSRAEARNLPNIFGNPPSFSSQFSNHGCITWIGELELTIRELMQEQRRRVCSGNPAERLAAALLIPDELSRRLRLLSDSQLGQLLDEEVCANMSLLAPEAMICLVAADRLRSPSRCNNHRE